MLSQLTRYYSSSRRTCYTLDLTTLETTRRDVCALCYRSINFTVNHYPSSPGRLRSVQKTMHQYCTECQTKTAKQICEICSFYCDKMNTTVLSIIVNARRKEKTEVRAARNGAGGRIGSAPTRYGPSSTLFPN